MSVAISARSPKDVRFYDTRDADGNQAASDEDLNAAFLAAAAKDDEILAADPWLAPGVSSSAAAIETARPS